MSISSLSKRIPGTLEHLIEKALQKAFYTRYGQYDHTKVHQRDRLRAKLRSFRPDDIKRHLKFGEEDSHLSMQFGATVECLSPEQYTLHLDRLEYAWKPLIEKVAPHRAWDTMIAYPDAEPGATNEESYAVFFVTAKFLHMGLLGSIVAKDNYTYDEESGGAEWKTYELAPEMLQLVARNASLLNIITNTIINTHADNTTYIEHMLSYYEEYKGEATAKRRIDQQADDLIINLYHLTNRADNLRRGRERDRYDKEPLFIRTSEFVRKINQARAVNDDALLDAYKHNLDCEPEDLSGVITALGTIASIINEPKHQPAPAVTEEMVQNMIALRTNILREHHLEPNPAFRGVDRQWVSQFDLMLSKTIVLGSPEAARYINRNYVDVALMLHERNVGGYIGAMELIESMSDSSALGSGVL